MKGWDAEAALLVPGLDKWCELWLIGGYGSFDNKPFGPQISGTGKIAGWKAGIEFRPIPQVILSTTRFENERIAGGELVYGLSLQIPLDPEPANPNESWWSKIKDSLHPRSRHLAERTIVPVRRQNSAVKVANAIGEPEITQYSKVVAKEERRVVVRDDVIFVNNGGPQGNGIAAPGTIQNGTAEQPYDTVREGVTLAATPGYQSRGAPTVYVAGGGPDYDTDNWFSNGNSDLPLRSGVQLTSGGYGVKAFAGQTFGLGARARIRADIESPNDKLSQYISIDGFHFLGEVFVNAATVAVRNNVIENGIVIHGSNVEVISNTIHRHFLVIGSQLDQPGLLNGSTSVVVSGNRFTRDGMKISLEDFDNARFTNNDLVWSIYSDFDFAPSAAANFLDCSNVTLGGNRITMLAIGLRPSGVAVFGFSGRTNIQDLGGNKAFLPNDFNALSVFGVSKGFSLLGPTTLSGSLSINDLQIPLSRSDTLLGRLW